MKADFSKNLVLLRKEHGFSQKKVAADLQVSQALLSHYEKGIRECGLEFVTRAADYYGVSSDFLLGRSLQRNFLKPSKISGDSGKNPDQKATVQSITIVFAILEKINSQSLTKEITNYLCAAVYTIFRQLIGSKCGDELFSLDSHLFSAMASAKMSMAKARSLVLLEEEALRQHLPAVTAESLQRDYPALAPGIQRLIHVAEQEKTE